MLTSLRLTLLLTLTIAAGIAGLFATFWDGTSTVQKAARAQDQFSMAFAQAARAHSDYATAPLTEAEIGTLPGGTVYCPAAAADLAKGLFFVLVHPGPDRALSTTCAQALAGERPGDDLVKAVYRNQIGNTEKVSGNTDWLPENYPSFKSGQVYVAGDILHYVDDTGTNGVFQSAGTSVAFSLKCPADMISVLGATAGVLGTMAAMPSYCLDSMRTDRNLTQSEAQADCTAKGKQLISDEQFSYLAWLAGIDVGPNTVSYDPTALGLVPYGWPANTAYRGLPKGSTTPEYGKGGSDEAATANPAARRWMQLQVMGSPGVYTAKVWDLVGVPQWTSTQVAVEDIGKPLNTDRRVASQSNTNIGYPNTNYLDRWPMLSTAAAFPSGVLNIGYLTACNEVLPKDLYFSPRMNSCVSAGTPEQRFAYFGIEALDAGWGGYYAEPTTGTPLGVTRGGPWAGTRMGSGIFAVAVLPTSYRTSHRCVLAPYERAGK